MTAELLQARLDTPERPVLRTETDGRWLNGLAGRELSSEEIVLANSLVKSDSPNLHAEVSPETAEHSRRIRWQFYGKLLGWENPDHQLHDSYSTFQERHPSAIPLVTMIEAQRVLDEYELDIPRIIAHMPSVLSYAGSSVREKIDNLTQLGIDASQLINAYPSAIGYAPASVCAKVRLMRSILRYSRSSLAPADIIEYMPATLGYSREKLRTLTRLIARHLEPADVARYGPRHFADIAIKPIDSVLAVASTAIEHPITDAAIQHEQATIRTSERRSRSLELLSSTTIRERLGERSVRAYFAYAPLKTDEVSNYPDLAGYAVLD